jgi:hypothetical protein
MAFIALVGPIYINAKQYGAVGDGITDDTIALQAALTAAGATPGSAVFLPTGVYMTSATLLISGNTALFGAGDTDGGTIIRTITGTALTTPLVASYEWYNNSTTCGNPVVIRDIKFDGFGATSGSGAHGLVLMNYWSIVERCSFINVAGDGFRFTAFAKNGTHITNTCVEVKLSRLQVRAVGAVGIHIYDDGTTLNSCTDGFLQDCIVQNAGTYGIYIEMGPGWLIQGNHVYGTGIDAMYVKRCYATRVIANYIDGYGSGSATYLAGIGMDILNGRGSSCIGNHVGYESSSATGPYQSIRITGAGSAASVCIVMGNTVNGNNGSGSLGYVIQTNVSQQTTPFTVYFHDNDATNVSGYSYVDSYTTGGDMTILNHITSFGSTPTATAGTNAGTSPPVPVKTTCTDLSGQITFGSGTSPAAGSMVIVSFYKSFAHAPAVVLTPMNSSTPPLSLYALSTTTGFIVSCVTAPAASQANTKYGFYYHVLA